MNSFDVFDTLIARRFLNSKSIWKQIEEEFEIKDFTNNRPVPDDGSKSFEEIYIKLANENLIPSEKINSLIKREIELEIENCYGIIENINLVDHGDILISDMYLPSYVILQMVRSCGLNKQVTIYQSNNGKGSGKVWKDLKNYPPQFHLGDNEHSDIRQAIFNKINAKYTRLSDLTEPEKFLQNQKLENLAFLCREIRLTNKVERNFLIANSLNLPLLFIFAEQIYRKFKNQDIYFLGRDCQLLWRIYNAYYGTSYYIPFSRRLVYCQPELAVKYLNNNISKNYILIDISSTGGTWKEIGKYQNFNICSLLFADSKDNQMHELKDLPNNFSYINPTSKVGSSNINIELFNCADHGMCSRLEYITDKILKIKIDDNELEKSYIDKIHKPIFEACSKSKYYQSRIREEIKNISDDKLSEFIKIYLTNICGLKIEENIKIQHSSKEDEYFNFITTLKNIL